MVIDSVVTMAWFALLASSSGIALAHGDEHGASATKKPAAMEETGFGQTGDPKKVTRTINVEMNDTFRYTPGSRAPLPGDLRAVTRCRWAQLRTD